MDRIVGHGGCNVALGGGCGGRQAPENLLFALFLPTKSAKKERKRGLGHSPKDFATTMDCLGCRP